MISSNVNFRDGQFINTRCFTLDVTNLKETENALRKAKEARATDDQAFAGIAKVYPIGRLSARTRASYSCRATAADELPDLTLTTITHPDDIAVDVEKFEALVDGKIDTYQIEKRFIRKDNSPLWVAISASMVRDQDGRALYGIGWCRTSPISSGRKAGKSCCSMN